MVGRKRWHLALAGGARLLAATVLVIAGAFAGSACARTPRSLFGAGDGEATRAGTSVRVVSMNTWLLPMFSKQMPERLARFPEALRAQGADVICLQEVWTPTARDALVKGLGPGYAASEGVRGGLVTLSRLSLLSQEFVPFPRMAGLPLEERLAGKGLLVTVHEVAGGRLCVVNTHTTLASPANEAHLEFLRAHVAPLLDLPMVVAGDLNTGLGSWQGGLVEEHRRWRSLDFTHADPIAEGCVGDLPADAAPPHAVPTRVGWPPSARSQGWTPDHILHRGSLARSTHARDYQVLFLTPADALSDHRGLRVEIDLRP